MNALEEQRPLTLVGIGLAWRVLFYLQLAYSIFMPTALGEDAVPFSFSEKASHADFAQGYKIKLNFVLHTEQ